MSRIGKIPIDVPAGVTVSISGARVSVKGPQGELSIEMPRPISATADGSKVVLARKGDDSGARSLHGLSRSLVANMVKGVSQGFRKDLEIEGVGFKADVKGNKLSISLGFSSPVVYEIPAGIKIVVEGGTQMSITGPDKGLVGEVAARIRGFYPAEPYKGKGIRHKGEHVRRKVGKTVA